MHPDKLTLGQSVYVIHIAVKYFARISQQTLKTSDAMSVENAILNGGGGSNSDVVWPPFNFLTK